MLATRQFIASRCCDRRYCPQPHPAAFVHTQTGRGGGAIKSCTPVEGNVTRNNQTDWVPDQLGRAHARSAGQRGK